MVGAVVVVLGDRRAGQARRHVLEVDQRRPHLLDRARPPRRTARASRWTTSRSLRRVDVGRVAEVAALHTRARGRRSAARARRRRRAARRRASSSARARAGRDGRARRRRSRARRDGGRGGVSTPAIACGVMNGWSASSDDRGRRPRRARPRPRAARPPGPRPSPSQTTISAPPRSRLARGSRSACAPSTTTTRSSAGTASIAASACSISGRPSSCASCLGPPKRRPSPAASTSPPISGLVSAAAAGGSCRHAFLHQRRPAASSEAIELPGSRRSTCGIAACMPRVSGA